MKRFTVLFLFVCLLGTSYANAQNNPCSKYDGRPMPDWIMGATPEPHNSSYYYKVFEGESSDREEARNKAIKKAFQQAITFIDATVNSADVFAAIEKGDNLNVLSDTYHIPIYFTCEFSKKTPDGTQWLYWILCQIATRGNTAGAQFDTHFTDCNTHDIWDKQKEECAKGIKDNELKSNAKALVASTFIPGLGQMIKGHGGAGTGILLSELAAIGGGVTCYYFGQQQAKIMTTPGHSYDEFKAAQKTKNTYDIMMFSCFGVAGVIHIVNMCNAWLISDKNLSSNYSFVPALIPTNEYSQKSYAVGAGVQIKF